MHTHRRSRLALHRGCPPTGTIDNTYLPAPLRNMWGKARELSHREVEVVPRKQCTDLLIVSKGGKMPPPAQTVEDMKTIREDYSKTIPLLHNMDPQRFDSGFVREPNIIPGARPAPKFFLNAAGLPAPGPEVWRTQKLRFDQTAANPRINVSRVVQDGPERRRPGSAPPKFIRTPAGLPGGLAIVEAEPTD